MTQPHGQRLWPKAAKPSGVNLCQSGCSNVTASSTPAVFGTARAVKGGTSPSRNFACGQVAPHVQAVNSSTARPSARVPISGGRSARSADVDADLTGGETRLRAQTEFDAAGRRTVGHDRPHH